MLKTSRFSKILCFFFATYYYMNMHFVSSMSRKLFVRLSLNIENMFFFLPIQAFHPFQTDRVK